MRQLAVALGLFIAVSASAEEVRQWRDASGRLHVTIEGDGTTPETAGDRVQRVPVREAGPEAKFSVEASRRRRELANRLSAAASELLATRSEIREREGYTLIVRSPAARGVPGEARRLLDAQRNALLSARAAEEENRVRLRELRRDERKVLASILEARDEVGQLEAELREVYGTLPAWWRPVPCAECPSNDEIQVALDAGLDPDSTAVADTSSP